MLKGCFCVIFVLNSEGSHLKLVPQTGKNRAVAPVRRPNSEYRNREHLTPAEVAKLIEAAKGNRYGLGWRGYLVVG